MLLIRGKTTADKEEDLENMITKTVCSDARSPQDPQSRFDIFRYDIKIDSKIVFFSPVGLQFERILVSNFLLISIILVMLNTVTFKSRILLD